MNIYTDIPCWFYDLKQKLCGQQYAGNRTYFNTLRPRQNGRHFKWIFLIENVWIPIKISLKSVPQGPINNIPALVQIMAWRRPGDKPLSGPMMVRLPTHICVTRPQWVKKSRHFGWLLVGFNPTVAQGRIAMDGWLTPKCKTFISATICTRKCWCHSMLLY